MKKPKAHLKRHRSNDLANALAGGRVGPLGHGKVSEFFIAFGKLNMTFFGYRYGVYRIHVWCIGKVESVE